MTSGSFFHYFRLNSVQPVLSYSAPTQHFLGIGNPRLGVETQVEKRFGRMKMQHTYGIFEAEADHLIELVRQHAPLAEVRGTGCPVCGAAIAVTFTEDGTGFSIACDGKPLHVSTDQDIADPPPWWRECVVELTDQTWYWWADHTFDPDGNLWMPMSGWQADGVRWSGEFACPVVHPDQAFWRWVLLKSGCTSDLIGDTELAELRARFATHVRGLPDRRLSD